MPAYSAQQLANAFRTVRKNTVQVAQDIPEDKYDFVPAAGMQTVGAMLSHIALSPKFQEVVSGPDRIHTLQGFDFPSLFGKIREEETKPRSKAEIVALLQSEGDRFAALLESMPDEQLAEPITEPTGQGSRTRLEHLLGAKEHEMHHRAQLMLIERMLGIVPHITRQREERQRQQQAAATAKA